MEHLARTKAKAELLFLNNKKVYIQDIFNQYHFCKILTIKEFHLVVKNFEGKRSGRIDVIPYLDIYRLNEYNNTKEIRADGTSGVQP